MCVRRNSISLDEKQRRRRRRRRKRGRVGMIGRRTKKKGKVRGGTGKHTGKTINESRGGRQTGNPPTRVIV